MLQSIRDKSKGWLAYIIVGLISIPFVFWGINEYLGVGGNLLAASVNDTEITVQQFQRNLQQRQQQLREMLGGNVPPDMLDSGMLQQGVLSDMIRQEVLRQTARDEGYRVSAQQLIAEIQAIPMFQENGTFSNEKYSRLLEQQRMSKAAFEYQVRESLQLNSFQQGLQDTSFIPQAMVQDFSALKNQQRKINLLILEKENWRQEVTVSDADVQAHYDANQNQYLTPEMVKLNYIVLDEASLVEQVVITEEEIRSHYDLQAEDYSTPETRKTSQILFKVAEAATDEEIKAVEEKALSAYEQIQGGTAFAELAKEISEDPLSAEQGGNLGFLSRGEMNPAFETALFNLDQGQISKPVKTDLGYHLIKVDEIKAAELQPFESVKEKIGEQLKQRQAEKKLIEKTEKLLTLTYENPESLHVAADELGIKIETTEWVTPQRGEGIAAEDQIRRAAFSTEVLQEKRNSDVIELPGAKQVVIRLNEYKPAAPMPFEVVKDEIHAMLTNQQLVEKVRMLGEGWLKTLNEKGEINDASATGVKLVQPDFITRNDTSLAQEVVTAVFKLNKPVDNNPVFAGVPMSNGNYALVTLLAVQDGKVEGEGAQEEIDNANTALRMNIGGREFEAAYQSLESRAKIKIFKENLQQ